MSLDGGSAFIHDDTISKICGHNNVMLDDHCRLLRVKNETFNDLRCLNTLFRIKICTRLVNQVNISRLSKSKNQRNTLELTTREGLHILIDNVVQTHGLHNICLELRVHKGRLDLLQKQHTNSALELGCNCLGLK